MRCTGEVEHGSPQTMSRASGCKMRSIRATVTQQTQSMDCLNYGGHHLGGGGFTFLSHSSHS